MFRRSARGFTLIEVLISTVILAGSLAVLFPLFASTLRQMRTAEAREIALLVAQSALSGLEADPVTAPKGGRSGPMRWTAALAPEGTHVGDLAAWRVTVAVWPDADPRTAPVELSSIVLGPNRLEAPQ